MVWYPQCLLNPLLPYFRVPFLRPYCQENCWVSIWTVACVQNVPQIDWEVYHLLYIIFPLSGKKKVCSFFSSSILSELLSLYFYCCCYRSTKSTLLTIIQQISMLKEFDDFNPYFTTYFPTGTDHLFLVLRITQPIWKNREYPKALSTFHFFA